ncbi:MAG TPA: amidohydrolase family protein [Acidimicrobiales bacterium]|nr:amidohydrolase family protein [Acidimicrobiales bacterium]
MLDMVIKGGTLVDGTGVAARAADVGVKDGVVAEVAPSIETEAAETIDAAGRLVTPGFVDIHTHYDGQATWDETLDPSAGHGVTTLVMGNCGVGFAPVHPGQEDWLIQLMEGVEDIPGTALSEGMTWGWETFPQYLDLLDRRQFAVDIGTQIPHGAVRGYVMGDRGARNEPATPTDIAAMADIVQEAIEAGALGFSTSRTIAHRAIDGEPVPGTYAAEDELFGIGRAMARGGASIFELAPAGVDGLDLSPAAAEMSWMRRLSADIERPVTFIVLQVDLAPDLWKMQMEESVKALDEGAEIYPQIANRPFGMLIGFQTHHPFALRPSYRAVAGLPLDERVRRLREPAVRAAILAEDDVPGDGGLWDGLPSFLRTIPEKLFVMGDPPEYEPTPDQSVAALAEAGGLTADEQAYDLLCEDDGRALLMLPLFNYTHGNHDVLREQMTHPRAALGLGDGGAHCGMICDASLPTYGLTHWARDRTRGPKLALEQVVQMQTQRTAQLYGLGDRGTIEVGKRADLNVIDHAALTLRSPRLAHDLPGGGRRLLQEASGYTATVVAGTVTRRDGVDTGARPGRLIRGQR